jgi:hypothetical protein
MVAQSKVVKVTRATVTDLGVWEFPLLIILSSVFLNLSKHRDIYGLIEHSKSMGHFIFQNVIF